MVAGYWEVLARIRAVLARVDWPFLCILASGLAVRLFAALDWNWHYGDNPSSLRGDEPGYAKIARELVNGEGFTWPARVPIYPAFLAAVFWLFGESYQWARVAQCGVSLMTIVLTFNFANRLFGRRAAMIAALLAAFSLPLVRQPIQIMSETLFTPVLLSVGIASFVSFESPTWLRFALLGFLVGVGDLIRPTLLLYPVVLVPAIWLLTPRRLALRNTVSFLLVLVLTLAPWVIHNSLKWKAFIPLTTTNAFLWQGSPEYFHLMRDQGYTYVRIWTEILYGPNYQIHDPSSVSGDRYWTRRALRSIANEPFIYLRFAVEKIFTYWVGDPSADWANANIFSYSGLIKAGYSPSAATKLIIVRAVPIVTIPAIVLLWTLRRRLATVYLLLLFTTAFHAATHAEARLSEPFQPFLLILIAGAFDRYISPLLANSDS